jgi:uncharacterized protein
MAAAPVLAPASVPASASVLKLVSMRRLRVERYSKRRNGACCIRARPTPNREPKGRHGDACDTSTFFPTLPICDETRSLASRSLNAFTTAKRECLGKVGVNVHTARAVPLDSNIRVFRSSIHGYGVVALRDFRPGELVAEVEGVLYRGDEIEDDRYCLWVDEDFYLDMVDQTRWINHSCDPNAEIEAELDGRGGAWARVVAWRLIRAGEEITYDYGFPQELAEPCSCGAPKCLGWIVDSDELPELIRRLARETAAPPSTPPSREVGSPARTHGIRLRASSSRD